MTGEREHTNYSIAFIDTEVEPKSGKILDIGAVKNNGASFHKSSIAEFTHFVTGTQFVCGHNILNHDIKYIGKALNEAGVNVANIIDTLFLSPLLFPTKPYHKLIKDDKLQSDDTNNPLNDSIKAKDLLNDEIAAFKLTDEALKQIFYLLLIDKKEFQAFFRYVAFISVSTNIENLIREKFKNEICEQVDLATIISEKPVELAYCLSLINSFVQHKKTHSITPPWVLKNYPEVEQIMFRLRNKPCVTGCEYCHNVLDAHRGLKLFLALILTEVTVESPCRKKLLKLQLTTNLFLLSFQQVGENQSLFRFPL